MLETSLKDQNAPTPKFEVRSASNKC